MERLVPSCLLVWVSIRGPKGGVCCGRGLKGPCFSFPYFSRCAEEDWECKKVLESKIQTSCLCWSCEFPLLAMVALGGLHGGFEPRLVAAEFEKATPRSNPNHRPKPPIRDKVIWVGVKMKPPVGPQVLVSLVLFYQGKPSWRPTFLWCILLEC